MSYDHANHPGFFVNAFNDVYSHWEEERTWWEILDGDLNHIPVGTRVLVYLRVIFDVRQHAWGAFASELGLFPESLH